MLFQKKQRIETTRHSRFREMVLHVIELFSRLVRAALLPHSLSKLDERTRATYGVWRHNDASPAGWLPSCVRCVRYVRMLAPYVPALRPPSKKASMDLIVL